MFLVIVILAFVALWLFDLNKILSVKASGRNAGDAAALAAARWQGITLNLVGDLNLLQAVAIVDALSRGATEFPEAEMIADIQSRLLFSGPMTGFLASQLAAKNNRIYANTYFTSLVNEHAQQVSEEYTEQFPVQPYTNAVGQPTAWDEYADMIQTIADLEIAAYPENRLLYVDYASSEHLLLNPSFYDAIFGRAWCWFYYNAMDTLTGYAGWQNWDDLPVYAQPEPINAEYFGLKIGRTRYLDQVPVPEDTGIPPTLDEVLDELSAQAGTVMPETLAMVPADWFYYRPEAWGSWTEFLPEGFPFAAEFKPRYDYTGADAAVRIETWTDRLSPGGDDKTITWTAAAKPFGYLGESSPPTRYGLVLPAFREVRLIPVDASSAPAGGTRPGWYEFIYEYLPRYVEEGLSAFDGVLGDCWYCQQLVTWEDAAFRQEGIDWLDENSSSCIVTGGGGGPGGGTRRGH